MHCFEYIQVQYISNKRVWPQNTLTLKEMCTLSTKHWSPSVKIYDCIWRGQTVQNLGASFRPMCTSSHSLWSKTEFLCWEETSCVATCEHHLVHSQIQFSMGSCRKVEYESLPDNIKCWQEGFWEKLVKANPLETGCWLSAVCEEGNASWDVINCPSRWSLFLSLALCVDHQFNSETGTAMHYLGWPSFQNDRENHPSPALVSNELS